MGAHARRLDDAAQGFLAPTSARLARAEDHPKLERFVGERSGFVAIDFPIAFSLHPAPRTARFRFAAIVFGNFELLFEGFDQGFDGFLTLGEFAFGRFLKFPEGLLGQPQEFRRGLFEGVRAQCFKGVAQVGQGLFLQRFLFAQQIFRRGLFGFRRRAGVGGFHHLCPRFFQVRFFLRDLLAQFIFQSALDFYPPI